MEDCSIIIDHLSCPAKPLDGMGMFNHTYSLTHSVKNKTFISKHNNKTPMYFVNEEYNEIEFNRQGKNYSIILNQLKELECHFCTLEGNNLIFIDYPRKIVAVCNDHISNGSKKEFSSESKELNPEFEEGIDLRRVINPQTKKITNIIDGEIITQNIYVTDLDLD
jgi:hypothetical protein